ncbi:MAG TPA: hypothetical protein DEQ20_06395 [Desulfobulbaceae bacterium]|nr:MAG: hypothetical protein A2520_02355 [Deltaproteobacteria bacterium RIFOXYD12_FULL_53_23]HCC54540.1 hypothetical protein [Desulfobulbaceae bacterium]
MVSIEIDDEIFNYLKSLAEPFVDTPNTVLRRLLFTECSPPHETSTKEKTSVNPSKSQQSSSVVFASSYLQDRYGEKFRTKAPFRTMFESEKHLIYFQNFNKSGTINLWYRLSESSLNTLRETTKIAIVCFTNPSENIIIEIPMKDIDKQIIKCSWSKDFLEVNIDPTNLRWRELDWSLQQYLTRSGSEEVSK